MGEPVVLVSLWQLKNTSNRLGGGRFQPIHFSVHVYVYRSRYKKASEINKPVGFRLGLDGGTGGG